MVPRWKEPAHLFLQPLYAAVKVEVTPCFRTCLIVPDPALRLCLQARKWSPYAFHILESLGLVTLTTGMACVGETFGNSTLWAEMWPEVPSLGQSHAGCQAEASSMAV